jgi:NhaA family Na+:H+ antiporter
MIKSKIISLSRKIVNLESFTGILLFSITIIALIWANSPFGVYYESLWQYEIGVSFHEFELKKPLILWVNDGLMSIFFFLIGLELKREIITGEINTIKKAAFPLIAAIGGVVVPVALYLILNQNPETARGWGIPMATDIAFALAILSTLGKRVPISLKIFLTAFAIIDDITAVLTIAVFYSTEINWIYILYGSSLTALLGLLYYLRKYSFAIGILTAVVIWFLFLKSGIHPTIAGVILAFTIPIKRRISIKTFSSQLQTISSKMTNISSREKNHLLSDDEIANVNKLDKLSFEVRSPLQHLEHKLHGLIAYFILPVFALANAGVVFGIDYDFNYSLMANIAISLFAGKFIGVAFFSYLGLKLNLTELPSGVNFMQIIGIAFIAGVGFTMSIFIDNLAFYGDLISINSVKIGIIIGSLLSGILGYIVLRLSSNKIDNPIK